MASVDDQIDRLTGLSAFELRTLWRRYWRQSPPMRLSRDLLVRGIAFKLQEAAFGGIGKIEQRKLAALARELRNSAEDNSGVRDSSALDVASRGSSFQTHGRAKPLPALSPTLLLREGNRLVREWNGTAHTVRILASGFEWQGNQYRSLSQIAEAITGAHWSGPRFFGLTKRTGQGLVGKPADSGLDSGSVNRPSKKLRHAERIMR